MANIILVRDMSVGDSAIWFHLPKIGNPKRPWKIMDLRGGGWSVRESKKEGPPEEGTWWKHSDISEELKRSVIQIIIDHDISLWFK